VKALATILSWTLAACVCCAAVAEGLPQQAPAVTGQPKCVVKEMVFDAGRITKGDPIKHDFILENQGTTVLEITSVKPGCGCTVTEYDPKIKPGKTGKISATVTTAAFSGPIVKPIAVTTSDPQMASFQLAIKAEVHSLLNVEPSETQQFGLVFKGQSLEKEFTIKAEDGAPFQVNSVEALDPALKYELIPAPDKKSAVFKVTLPAEHGVGPINGRFTLSTTHPKIPTLTINVFGTVRDPLTLSPEAVHFSGMNRAWVEEHPDDVSLKKSVILSDEQGAGLEIKSATSTLTNVGVEVKELEPKKRFSVELQIKPPAKAGDFSGEVTILTNLRTFKVPVTGTIF
jgi:hypothetical protein